MFFENQNSRVRGRKGEGFLDSIDEMLQNRFKGISDFFRMQAERDRLLKIEEAIELVGERRKLRDKVVGLSLDDPGFLKELNEVLRRLGL